MSSLQAKCLFSEFFLMRVIFPSTVFSAARSCACIIVCYCYFSWAFFCFVFCLVRLVNSCYRTTHTHHSFVPKKSHVHFTDFRAKMLLDHSLKGRIHHNMTGCPSVFKSTYICLLPGHSFYCRILIFEPPSLGTLL